MGYFHFEVTEAQALKRNQPVCGDVVQCERTRAATTVLLCDGIGSGIKARIAARMAATRLFEFLRNGVTVRQSFVATAGAINRIRDNGFPYAAFSVAHILTDGSASILSYDMPPPIVVNPRSATLLNASTQIIDDAVITQSHCALTPGDSLLLVSDGVTQAGLGIGGSAGWDSEGVLRAVAAAVQRTDALHTLPETLVNQATALWGGTPGDDTSAVLISCRRGHALTVLTGPPRERDNDEAVVERFVQATGSLAVCGASTAQMLARVTGRRMRTEQRPVSFTAPPPASIEGVDLVTEGAVTLNQLFHIIDEDPAFFEPNTPVTKLYNLVMNADRIEFLVGGASNPAEGDISFVQSGILPRSRIVPQLAERLRSRGKLVVVESVD